VPRAAAPPRRRPASRARRLRWVPGTGWRRTACAQCRTRGTATPAATAPPAWPSRCWQQMLAALHPARVRGAQVGVRVQPHRPGHGAARVMCSHAIWRTGGAAVAGWWGSPPARLTCRPQVGGRPAASAVARSQAAVGGAAPCQPAPTSSSSSPTLTRSSMKPSSTTRWAASVRAPAAASVGTMLPSSVRLRLGTRAASSGRQSVSCVASSCHCTPAACAMHRACSRGAQWRGAGVRSRATQQPAESRCGDRQQCCRAGGARGQTVCCSCRFPPSHPIPSSCLRSSGSAPHGCCRFPPPHPSSRQQRRSTAI